MAFAFPLSLANFFGSLRIASCTFDLPEALELSRTAGGEIIRADIGARLWQGSVTLVPAFHADAEAIKARLSILRQAGASLFVSQIPKAGPRYDRTGAILGAATPTIHTLDTGNREMRLQGLPSGYVLAQGDMLSFSYGSAPTRYALHQIVSTGATAAGTGITPLFEVTPNIRPGAVVGAAVQLIKPVCKAVIVPGSVSVGQSAPLISAGATFSFIQTLG